MATEATTNDAPKPEPWAPPDADQEFEFTDTASIPAWADKGWASYDRGPALAIPAGDLYGNGPYHTKTAHIGDKVMFIAGKGGVAPHFEIVPGAALDEVKGTKRPPQQSAATEEDMLKTGILTPDDLGDDAKAQIVARSPQFRAMIEEGKGLPEATPVSDFVKTG